MLTFALAVFLLIVTPGPGVMTTAGVGAAFGQRPGLAYVTGLFIGTNLVALAVVTGLAALIFGLPGARPILAIAATAYLLYLAARIALSGSQIRFIAAQRPPGITGGLALQAINPKAYVVNTQLFSGFPFWADAPMAEMLVKFAIMNLIWVPIHLGWLAAGIALHRLELAPPIQRAINIAMAMALVAVVLLALTAAPGFTAD